MKITNINQQTADKSPSFKRIIKFPVKPRDFDLFAEYLTARNVFKPELLIKENPVYPIYEADSLSLKNIHWIKSHLQRLGQNLTPVKGVDNDEDILAYLFTEKDLKAYMSRFANKASMTYLNLKYNYIRAVSGVKKIFKPQDSYNIDAGYMLKMDEFNKGMQRKFDRFLSKRKVDEGKFSVTWYKLD